MLEIAGGILLAVAVLAMLAATLRYIILALSAVVSLAMAAGAWLLLSSVIGQWWATAVLIGGFAGVVGLVLSEEIGFWSMNQPSVEKASDGRSAEPGKEFGRKRS